MEIHTLIANNSLTFINLHTEDNPLLDVNDDCYFLIQNSVDYHLPIIAKGKIIYDRFNETINKSYFLQIWEFIDDKEIIENFIYNKQIPFYHYNADKNTITMKAKHYFINEKTTLSFFEKNLYCCNSFFVRQNLDDIKKLRKSFCDIILKDLHNQINEINILLK